MKLSASMWMALAGSLFMVGAAATSPVSADDEAGTQLESVEESSQEAAEAAAAGDLEDAKETAGEGFDTPSEPTE